MKNGKGSRAPAKNGKASPRLIPTRMKNRKVGSRFVPRPPPTLPRDAHKGLAGRVTLFCGSRSMPGAAVLCARAAQRAGAGLVRVVCGAPSLPVALPIAAPEAILYEALPWSAARARSWLRALEAAGDHARLAGPGLGNTRTTRALVERLLDDPTPLVLDADALNALGHDLELLRRRPAPTVLTPHPGEAERLLGRPIPRTPAGRIEAAREISERSAAIVCLKGSGTVVAGEERVYVNGTGNPGMATAGAGDVLAGILVAYLAACSTGLDPDWTPYDAAASAVRVHGLAGDLAAKVRGERGLVASDLVEFLPMAQARWHRA